MKTRLDEGGTERCELSTPSPRARYGIKVAEGGNDGTFRATLIRLLSEKREFCAITIQKAEHATSAVRHSGGTALML